jgi:ligand-binding SRPBCC domain-containing protein
VKIHELQRELWLPRPLTEIFPFFTEATNLEALTPPWLNFRILSPRPILMRVGTLINYRIVVHGMPFRWQSEITVWEPPHRFVDEQRRGPYRIWRHEHRFAERDKGTIVSDRVQYAVLFDSVVHRWLVRPDIERIFSFRTKKMQDLFGGAIPQFSS